MRKTLLLYIIFQILLSSLYAQSNYPVYVTPTLTPPYSLNLSDYSKFGSQKLMVTIHANDLNISNLPVKLRISIETMGVTIENPPSIVTTPIYINGGETTILFGTDLQDYFNINNLIFKGYSKETYNRTGQLPEGFYKFTVEVLYFNSNRLISNQGTATAWMVLGKPPVLKLPENNAQMGKFKGMPLTFSWLSSNVGSPVSANTIQYKFEMWEMHVPGINPNIVAASTPVFHEYTSFNTVYTLYPNSLLMTPGMQYAWRVTASDLSGFVPFEQNGHSEIRTFTYKVACDSITNLSGSHKGRNGSFTWDVHNNHTSFNIEMRNPESNWFSNSQSFENKAEFFDLDYGTTYEMRVQAVCDGDPESKSDFSDWKSITIPLPAPPDTADCADCICDDQIPGVELQNFDLRNNLQVGDTIVNKTGTSRFILKTVEPQGNGTYKGVFLFWAEIWKLKFICNYWDLQVNTDNVIVNMDFESVYDPQFLIDVDATVNYLDSLAGAITTLTEDVTPDDTLAFDGTITTIYVNGGDSVIAVTVDENGNTTEVVISDDVNNLEETLIQGENGEEYVVTKDGEVMGLDEYINTGGGNSHKIDDYNEEKEEKNLSDDVTVNFTSSTKQKYGFDQYNDEKSSLQSKYPSLKNGYRSTYKSIASFSTDLVGVSNSGDHIIFKDEMGIPALKTGEDLTLRGSVNGSDVALYAYQVINDTTEKIAGKLNVLSFDEQAKKLYIIPVNGAATPDATSLQNVLNKVYAQAITRWEVTKLDNLPDVTFENGNMTHGGSSAISVYNNDQKTIVNTFEDKVNKLENNAYYLFFVENVQFKDRSIAGYMPLQYQVGFIYDNPNLNIIAHELGHGSFNLYHTFCPDHFIAAEQTTENLMDYKGGTDLWKHQWDFIHDPQTMLFSFLQDESEGAAIQNLADGNYYSISENKWENYAFLSPIGTAINITGATDVKFNEDGAILNFKKDGKTYYGVHSVETQRFVGYLSQDDKSILNEHSLLTTEFEAEFNQKKYTGITYATTDQEVIAYFKQKDGENYLDCLRKATWKNESVATDYTGIANPPFIPEDAVSLDISGNQCVNYAAEGVHDGVGKDIYINLKNVVTEEQKPQLVELANYFTDSISNKKFAFYGYGLEDYYSSGVFNEQVILYLKNNKIYSKELLKQKFPYIVTQARDFGYIFSNTDLWAYSNTNPSLGVPEGYNVNSLDYVAKKKGQVKSYEYSFADLIVRKKCLEDGTVIKTAILNFEETGKAEPIAEHEFYDQYVAQFGTDAAYPFIAKTAAEWSKDLLAAYFLNQIAAEYGVMLINEAAKNIGKEAFKKLIKEKGKDFIQGAVIDYGIQATFSYVFDDKSFAEAASPGNINWISVGASGLESTLTINNKYAEYGVTVSFACFVNGWSDAGGFKNDFDVTNCAIGVVGAVLGKQVPLVFKYLKKYASYSVSKLKTGLAKLNITGQQADEIIEKIKNSVDEGSGTSTTSTGKLLSSEILQDLTPEVPSGNFINKTKFNNSASKIDVSDNADLKSLVDDVIANGDVDVPGGSKTEQIQDILFEDAGYTRLDGKTGSNNGLDGLYIKGTVDNPVEIIIGEAKQWGSSGGVSVKAANADTRLPQQMSNNWIQNVADRLENAGKKEVAEMLRNNTSKIQKYITVVNKSSQQVNVLKLGAF